jgi:MinD superfamily P-loop ATPase
MKELVVISGKGGTGKTTLVAAFADLARPVVIADCDVDAADLHLLANPEILETEPFMGGKKATVRQDACTGTGRCVEICRFDAVVLRSPTPKAPVRAFIDPIACEGCGACAHFCTSGAIDLDIVQEGERYRSRSRFGPMAHGKLQMAGEASGLLVTAIRRDAARMAAEEKLDLIILDGSPGIGCPVIASVAGADCVLAVCEPTLSGLHDLERVLGLAAHFSVPAMVCVNKFDINLEVTEKIEAYCAGVNVPVEGRLTYSGDFVKSQIARQSLTEFQGPAADEVRALWGRIVQRLDAIKENPAKKTPPGAELRESNPTDPLKG